MSTIHALFYVREMTYGNTEYVKVVLSPVTRNVAPDPHSSANPGGGYMSPNEGWAKYTPSGEIWMNVWNGTGNSGSAAVAEFERARREGIDIPITFEIPVAVKIPA